MTARSIARADSKDADPMAGTPLNVERSMMSAMCSAASGLPLRAWTRAAPKASPGWRSKTASSKLASQRSSRSP